jgi:hypothetical protein
MSDYFNQPWFWFSVMISFALIALGWVGYETVGQELLINQLPLCS